MDLWAIIAAVLAVLVAIFAVRRRPLGSVTVSDIIIYPIKSCGGVHLQQCKLTPTGLFLDREWAIVDSKGDIVTARDDPRLWKLLPAVDCSGEKPPTELRITYGSESLLVDLTQTMGERLAVKVWEETAEVAVYGPHVSNWFQAVLSKDYRLCRIIAPRVHSDPEVTAPSGTVVSLADMMQFLVASEASLQAVISHLSLPKKKQLTMSCFRPNVTVTGASAFAEDSWREIRINELKLIGVGPCSRCSMTTIDPDTLEKDQKTEPLPTLRKLHGVGLKGYFGQWFIRTGNGEIRVGDRVQVLARKIFPN